MRDASAMIEQKMVEAVGHYFRCEGQTELALSFVAYKTNQPLLFGELTVLHYEMFARQKNPFVFQAAAAVELMILALDIFDDLQDQDNPSVPWNHIDSGLSMNIAIGLLSLSEFLLADTQFEPLKKLKAMRCLSGQVIKAVKGQHVDLVNAINSEEEYIQMVREKSGSLMACACLIGTILSTERYHDWVQEYAEMMGIAAQISNDLQDICRWDQKNDLIHKKRTLPVLLLLQSSDSLSGFLQDYYNGKTGKESVYERKAEIRQWIADSGAVEYSEVVMRVHQLQAVERIKSLDVPQEWIEHLLTYIDCGTPQCSGM